MTSRAWVSRRSSTGLVSTGSISATCSTGFSTGISSALAVFTSSGGGGGGVVGVSTAFTVSTGTGRAASTGTGGAVSTGVATWAASGGAGVASSAFMDRASMVVGTAVMTISTGLGGGGGCIAW
ncbi:hypothetical protein [Allostella humosa]|uniref:hypothetical protein n=1 Tax=Stella humosa TaxID=94 RepID=UPI001152C2D9|nr:hypothetical protein [Stella humosa]